MLGRGLSALLSESPTTTSEELKEIDTNLIDPNPVQPRSRFDEKLLEELVQSIKNNGIVQPLLVRRVHNDRYQIIAGERRWRAAQRAGLSHVPAVIKDIPDDRMLELALIENIQRQELNAIEEAYAYKRLIETLGLTQEIVAQRVGRDRTFITNYLRLLKLPEDIQRLVEEGKLSMGHARALLGVDDINLQRKIAKKTLDVGLSVRDVEKAVKNNNLGTGAAEQSVQKFKSDDANLRLAETKLRRVLGTQVKLLPNHNSAGGKIEIHYYDESDLNRLYELIVTTPANQP